jgi:hypothetical protein
MWTNFISGWVSLAVFATAIALAAPCLAQHNNHRSPPSQRQSAPLPHSPAQPAKQQSHPQPRGHAQAQGHPQQQGHAGYWLQQHKDQPPAEQQRALQNDPQFRKLTPQQQEQMRQRLQHFSGLPPEQQQRMLNRMETWEHLTPEQKSQAREVFGRMQQLPADRRHMVGTAIRDLRAMPQEQREQIINSDRFKGMFSPQERDIMRGATKLPLAPSENGGSPE